MLKESGTILYIDDHIRTGMLDVVRPIGLVPVPRQALTQKSRNRIQNSVIKRVEFITSILQGVHNVFE